MSEWLNKVHFGDCRDRMREMIAAGVRVNTCVTSPPYWGLRDYGVEPSVWGGDLACAHAWGAQVVTNAAGYEANSKARWNHQRNGRGEDQAHMQDRAGWTRKEFPQGAFCECGAWRGSLGLEPTPEMYATHIVQVLRLTRYLLADDATLWLNLGDTYASAGGRGEQGKDGQMADRAVVAARNGRGGRLASPKHAAPEASAYCGPNRYPQSCIKPKDLVGIPWMVAFALRADGWYLRQDIIWHKPNPMPESVRDRCTKAHEYIFLLSKSGRYYYDADAIAEPVGDAFANDSRHQTGSNDHNDKDGYEAAGAQNPKGPHRAFGKWSMEGENASGKRMTDNVARARAEGGTHDAPFGMTRNRRSVWTVTTKPYAGAHFATFPPDLIEPCILAGSPQGGVVLDPFMGSGTTAEVAQRLGRQWIGCELNELYAPLQEARTRQAAMPI